MNHYVLLANAKDVETFATAAQADLYAAAVGGARMYTPGQLKKLLTAEQLDVLLDRIAEYRSSIADGKWWRAHAGSDRYALFTFANAQVVNRHSRKYLNFLPREGITK